MNIIRDRPDLEPGQDILDWNSPGFSHPLGALEKRLKNFSARSSVEDIAEVICGTRSFRRDQPAWADRGDLANLFVLESGWAYKFAILAGGRRHISEFFGPGAICNWSRLSDFEEQGDILFKAGAKVTMLNASALNILLEEQPGLGAVVRQHEIARTLRTTQRVRTVISSAATEKLLFLLLDLQSEATAVGLDPIWLALPFSQIEMADILGLTPVHVSRTFAKLEEDGLITKDGRYVQLHDVTQIRETLSYRAFFDRSRSG
ncbi:Crp/Fnr family transcriptional regulator [Aurantiacibacter rhizosphaerae]|uniref:Helix-turn-helix domain-containing protein n=1 Tax=Aurantiacibacter rhizosphaerae TaxID=2691582 RepID=A0A844XBP1_9SPHN|nr:Crp/Fnr family transcriptional regulator [Aurantiacibacter rhizosphaerae]MWV27193.1 helix-turn-helix domain-containing protein [Aurantiacibacter rhizosphaerae]